MKGIHDSVPAKMAEFIAGISMFNMSCPSDSLGSQICFNEDQHATLVPNGPDSGY